MPPQNKLLLSNFIIMKKIHEKIVLALIFLLISTTIYAQQNIDNTWYSLYDLTEYSKGGVSSGTIHTYNLEGPNGTLSFDAKTNKGAFGRNQSCNIDIYEYVNNNWNKVTTVLSNSNYPSFSCSISRNATQIRFDATYHTYARFIKNVKVTMASYLESNTTSLTMPSTEIGTATTASFSISHSNIALLTVSSNNNSVFTPNITTITESGEGKYGTSTITITYNPNAVGTQEGIITIGNGTQQIQIAVQGSATKKQQQISWQDNIDIIPENYLIENAAQASSGLEVSYESDNEAVIIVENNHLRAVGVGTAIITATQAGDDTWEAASSTKEIEVTALEIQTITWEQDFLRLKLGDAPITLNATASSGEAINYVSGDNTIILVDGNQLTIVGTGTTTLTAQQVGNTIYAPASLTKVVRVREVSENCDELSLSDQGSYNLGESGSKTFTLPRPGALLTYSLYIPGSATGEMKVTEFLPDGTSNRIHHISSIYSLSDYISGKTVSFTDIPVNPQATSIKFEVSGTLNKTISNIIVTQATYLEADQPNITAQTSVGTIYSHTLTVNYSNMPDYIYISSKKNLITIDNTDPIECGCGDFGSKTLQLSALPQTAQTLKDTLVFTSASYSLEVPIELNVLKRTQAIQWEQDFTQTRITDIVPLTASASSGLDISYTVDNEEIAVIENNQLRFIQEGTVTITATQDGDENYEAAQSMQKTITVSRITPSILQQPTATTITYGQNLAESVLENGTADVEGTFAWETPELQPNAGDNQTFNVIFTPNNIAHYNAVVTNATVSVQKAQQTITWEQNFENVVVSDIITLTASASSGLDISYTVDNEEMAVVEGNQLRFIQVGTITITATQAGNENYEAAQSMQKTITVNRITPTILQQPTATTITYGQSLAEAVLENGTADVEGTFAWETPEFQPNAGDNQTFNVIFTPANAEAYNSLTFSVTVNVNKAPQVIAWEQDLTHLHIGEQVELTAVASSGLPVVYTTENTSILTIEGNILSTCEAGSIAVTATVPESENYLEAISATQTVIIQSSETPTHLSDTKVSYSIYPNPTDNELNIQSENNIRHISIYDVQGKLMYSENINCTHSCIQTSTWPNGTYFIECHTETGKDILKFIRR